MDVDSTSLLHDSSTSLSTSQAEQDKAAKDAKAMPPPPTVISSNNILEPELKYMTYCFKNAVVKMGQIYSFYADTNKLGISKYAPNPPKSLIASLGHEIEKYDQLCDSMESHLLHAIATLKRDLRQEEGRAKETETTKIQVDSRSPTASQSDFPTSTLGTTDDAKPATSVTNVASLPGRRPSAISISSLHRPAFPLKLDLSSSSLRFNPDEASIYSNGLASPVTLAPKSARPMGPNEFPPDLIAAFASASASVDTNQPIDIDLTIPEGGVGTQSDVRVMEDSVGDSSDKPIELDLDAMDMDIDISRMTDLFGDHHEDGTNALNSTVESLYSPRNGGPDDLKSAGDDNIAEKSLKNSELYSTFGVPDVASEIFDGMESGNSSTALPKSPGLGEGPNIVSSSVSLLEGFSPQQINLNNSTNPVNIDLTSHDTSFDLDTLDLSPFSPGFFTTTQDSEMNFTMDMNGFLEMGDVADGKRTGEQDQGVI